MYIKTALPPDLRDVVDKLEAAARKAGLDFFPTIFELIEKSSAEKNV